jgi:hypothetical protein
MGYLLFDPPLDVYRTAAAAEAYLADLDAMAQERAGDDEALSQIQQERARITAHLDRLQANGDDESADDPFEIEPDE